MANICEYHILVRGKRNACHALYGGMAVYDDKEIFTESGTDEECNLVFRGTCKWSVDSYTGPYTGPKELIIPKDPQESVNFGENFWGVTLQDKSKLFRVEVWCNSVDIDDPIGIISEHYDNGIKIEIIYEDMPEEISMDEYVSLGGYDEWGEIEAMMGAMSLEEIEDITGVSVESIREHFNVGEEE